jgi:hypothetical protein
MILNELAPDNGASSERVAALSQTLRAIETMGLEELRAFWTSNFGKAPALRSADLMRLSLSWRLQARSYGGLDAALRRQLKRAVKGRTVPTVPDPNPGTILSREWQGQTFEVEVLEAGCRMNGQTYRSLSAVASAITGTRWNGPAFFGLRGEQA